jgi:hypothetical protein
LPQNVKKKKINKKNKKKKEKNKEKRKGKKEWLSFVIKENTSQAFQDFKNHVIYSLLS